MHNKRLVRQVSDRHLRSATNFLKFSPGLLRLRLLPNWVLLSLVANGFLLSGLLLALLRQPKLSAAHLAPAENSVNSTPAAPAFEMESGPESNQRHQLTYTQWVNQLGQEAKVIAEQHPKRLSVLAGDSISLWFPNPILPTGRTWLNQGISGETSSGLLKRLDLFDRTEPETIFVMIGINDLLRGTGTQAIVDNQQQIIRYLRDTHPQSQIVMQSILPHADEQVKWEGRDRLLAIPNSRIRELNQQLEAIAKQEGIYFLDLYPLFADPQGNLRHELSTDGLHLSSQGYQTWSIALQVYSREVLEPDVASSGQ